MTFAEGLELLRAAAGAAKEAAEAYTALRKAIAPRRCKHRELLTLHHELDGEHAPGTECRCRPKIRCLLCGEVLDEGEPAGEVSRTQPEA